MMTKRFAYIITLTVSVLVFLTSCQGDRASVIPREDMSRIYAEMMLTDQWILETPNARLIADTSLVYAPILEKYGYDAADYPKSVDHYMDDPERFAKILKGTGAILDARLAELELKKEELERLKKIRQEVEKFRPDVKWDEVFKAGMQLDSIWKATTTRPEKKEKPVKYDSRAKKGMAGSFDGAMKPESSKKVQLNRQNLKLLDNENK